MNSSLAASRAAARAHERTVAAGPPRSARWTAPSAAATAVGAAVAWPLLRPASVVLASVTVLLLAVVRQDRREAWRFVPEPVAPARVLPPLRPPQPAAAAVPSVPAVPPVPAVKAVHVPTQPAPLATLPRPRVPVARTASGAPRVRVAGTRRPSRSGTR